MPGLLLCKVNISIRNHFAGHGFALRRCCHLTSGRPLVGKKLSLPPVPSPSHRAASWVSLGFGPSSTPRPPPCEPGAASGQELCIWIPSPSIMCSEVHTYWACPRKVKLHWCSFIIKMLLYNQESASEGNQTLPWATWAPPDVQQVTTGPPQLGSCLGSSPHWGLSDTSHLPKWSLFHSPQLSTILDPEATTAVGQTMPGCTLVLTGR